MRFEVINSESTTLMQTTTWLCIPDKPMLTSMAKAGYRFKLDGRIITPKKLDEKMKELDEKMKELKEKEKEIIIEE